MISRATVQIDASSVLVQSNWPPASDLGISIKMMAAYIAPIPKIEREVFIE